MTRLAVSGFASLDYPLSIGGFAVGDATTLVTHRDMAAWPRIGGCPTFVAAAALQSGISVAPVTWVGSDDSGRFFRERLFELGCDISGVHAVDADRSPASVLVYQQDGSCICLYDPVFAGREPLSAAQRDTIASADHLAMTVGPAHLIEAILEARKPGAGLSWVLKNDAKAYPEEARARLAVHASLIFCNSAERKLVPDAVAPETVIVVTQGAGEIIIEAGPARKSLKVEKVDVGDTTGAGDTFAGGYLAALLTGDNDPLSCAESGVRAVRALLLARKQANLERR